jgi:hypothetical protein
VALPFDEVGGADPAVRAAIRVDHLPALLPHRAWPQQSAGRFLYGRD